MSGAGDAPTTRRTMSRTRRPAEGDSVGGRGRDDRLSRQVDAQVPPGRVPVLRRVAAQFHPRLKLRQNSSVTPFKSRVDRAKSCPRTSSVVLFQGFLCRVYTIQPVVKPARQPVGQPDGCLYTRYSRLSNRLFNRLNNRLYRVNGVLHRRHTYDLIARFYRATLLRNIIAVCDCVFCNRDKSHKQTWPLHHFSPKRPVFTK